MHYLERLLASANKYIVKELLYLVLVNVDEQKAGYLKKLHKNLEISHDFVKFKNLEEQRGYCTNRRATLFPKLMEIYNTPIVWVDVDSLFVRNGLEMIEYAKEYDLSIIYRENEKIKAETNKSKNITLGPLGTPFFNVFPEFNK